MSTIKPPPLRSKDDLYLYLRELERFLNDISGASGINWANLDFTNSTLTDILTRLHSDLQGRTTAGAHPATAIDNSPAGGISAATVQAAINELDTEKFAIANHTKAVHDALLIDADTVDGSHAAAFQPVDATLSSLALLGTAADRLAYTTALDTWAEAVLTAAGRALIDDASAAAQLITLGAIGHALATAANDFLVASGSGTFVKKTLAETKTILGIPYVHPNHSGEVTSVADGAQTIAIAPTTWTPVITFGGGSTGVTYHANNGGNYIKAGKAIMFSGRLMLTSNGTSVGAAFIGGLPYAAENNAYSYFAVSFHAEGVTFANQMIGAVQKNTTTISLEEMTEAGAVTQLTDVDVSNTAEIRVSGIYFTP